MGELPIVANQQIATLETGRKETVATKQVIGATMQKLEHNTASDWIHGNPAQLRIRTPQSKETQS